MKLVSLAGILLALVFSAPGKNLEFGGYTWTVRSGKGGPGPNAWDENNVWLFQGKPPKNGQEVEVIIHQFKFAPE